MAQSLGVRHAFKALAATSLLVAAWHLASAVLESYFLPGPLEVLPRFLDLLREWSTWRHVAASFTRVLLGLLIGLVAGLAMGVAPRHVPKASFLVEGVVQPVLESVPAICWALVFATMFGLAGTAPVLVVAAAVTPFFTVNMWEGVKELDESLIEMAQSFTKSRLRIMRHVVLPMLYPYLFAALRTSFQVSWKVVVMGEVFGALDGVGYMLWLAFSSYDPVSMLSWVLLCALMIAFFEYAVFNYLDRRYVRRWRR